MTRSATFVAIVSLVTFATVAEAETQTILAAVPSVSEQSVRFADLFLAVFTGILAFTTWKLWKATNQLAVSTKGLQDSAEAQGRDMQKSLDYAGGQLESANAQRAKNLGDQLFEFDKLLISRPSLQIELEKLRNSPTKFRDANKDACFVRLKSFIYMHLNFFDEIVSTYQDKSVDNVEYNAWCKYIIEKMKHPAYKDVMDSDHEIFGDSLKKFIHQNRKEIDADNGKAWQW